jgi:hypothetical protein
MSVLVAVRGRADRQDAYATLLTSKKSYLGGAQSSIGFQPVPADNRPMAAVRDRFKCYRDPQ